MICMHLLRNAIDRHLRFPVPDQILRLVRGLVGTFLASFDDGGGWIGIMLFGIRELDGTERVDLGNRRSAMG